MKPNMEIRNSKLNKHVIMPYRISFTIFSLSAWKISLYDSRLNATGITCAFIGFVLFVGSQIRVVGGARPMYTIDDGGLIVFVLNVPNNATTYMNCNS